MHLRERKPPEAPGLRLSGRSNIILIARIRVVIDTGSVPIATAVSQPDTLHSSCMGLPEPCGSNASEQVTSRFADSAQASKSARHGYACVAQRPPFPQLRIARASLFGTFLA